MALLDTLLAETRFVVIASGANAEANLKKGVKSIAYMVWRNGVALEWYLGAWFVIMYVYQLFLIVIGVLAPLTGITFLVWPFLLAELVLLRADFRKVAGIFVITAAMSPVLLLVGQALG